MRGKMSRRDFLRLSAAATGAILATCRSAPWPDELAEREPTTPAEPELQAEEIYLREALYYQKLDEGQVWCRLCFRKCILAPRQRSFCRNRENHGGRLYTLVHSKPCAVHVDPIEKEPQHHMLPGSKILCLATPSCNFRCKFCHNWHISQRSIEEVDYHHDLPPQRVVQEALKRGVPTISFTYTEPTVCYEYMYDIARLAQQSGVRILFHSNGSLAPEPLKELLKYTDAVTIDLKGFTSEFYREVSSAELMPVLETLKIIRESGVWLEIVNLIIPTLNDDLGDIEKMCRWIKEHLGGEVPLHLSRFVPSYKLTHLPLTPVETLEAAWEVANEAGLDYVSIGNVPGHLRNSTFCPRCGERLIHRVHFTVLSEGIEGGRCKFCGHKIPGIWV